MAGQQRTQQGEGSQGSEYRSGLQNSPAGHPGHADRGRQPQPVLDLPDLPVVQSKKPLRLDTTTVDRCHRSDG